MFNLSAAVMPELDHFKGHTAGHCLNAVYQELDYLRTDRSRDILGDDYNAHKTKWDALYGFFYSYSREFGSTALW